MAERHRRATKTIHVKFVPDQHSLLLQMKQARGADLTAIIRMAVEAWLAQDIPRLRSAGLWPKEHQEEPRKQADPQPRTRRAGRVRKTAASMVLAAFIAGSTVQSQAAEVDSIKPAFVVWIFCLLEVKRKLCAMLSKKRGTLFDGTSVTNTCCHLRAA